MKEAFESDGIVFVRGAFSPDEAAVLRGHIWRHIETHTPVREHETATWTFAGNFGLGAVERRAIWYSILESPAVMAAIHAVSGHSNWTASPPHILLTFPTTSPWSEAAGWHVDFGEDRPTWPVFALKLFALLDDVGPHGGGTMLRVGSHTGPGGEAVEFTGAAGDVVLTHMQVSHSPSMNTSERPRQMIGASYVANNIR